MTFHNSRALVDLRFEVVQHISNLEFYSGIYWNAMLRDWLRPYLSQPLAELAIFPVPLLNGFTDFFKGDFISLIISTPFEHLSPLYELFEDELKGKSKSRFPDKHLHFVPGRTIVLRSYRRLELSELSDTAGQEYLEEEVKLLSSLEKITLLFPTPLRLKPALPESSFRYLDPFGFNARSFFSSFYREAGLECDIYPELAAKFFLWMDVPYEKTLGGLVGGMAINNPIPTKILSALVWKQFEGIGKNRSFGFGFYVISEGSLAKRLRRDDDIVSFLKRAADVRNLSTTLEEMRGGSPGPDSLSKEDLLACGKSYLMNASRMLREKKLLPGETLTFRKRSRKGKYRIISVQNIQERHLLLSILKQISGSVERLLLPGCFSYRQGRDYHQAVRKVFMQYRKGFQDGIKGDVDSYFDSICRTDLALLIRAIFIFDPIAEVILSNLLSEGTGIPQGNPLSPMLSNLYLTPFDRLMNTSKRTMIRYGDDFCIFDAVASDEKTTPEYIRTQLQILKLGVSAEKGVSFKPEDQINFCGYQIDANQYQKIRRVKDAEEEITSVPLFHDEYLKGKPLYLTFKDSYTRYDNGALVIEKDTGSKTFSLKEISRIVVIGKPRISSGVIQQALLLKIPVIFMSINGKIIGGFAQHKKLYNPQEIYNSADKDWDAFSLNYAKNLAAAKIHNQRMLLKQNKIDEPRLKNLELSLDSCTDIESLRGKEGASSQVYWHHFRKLVKPLDFPRRAYHPPEGPVNAMLSLGYSNLYYRMAESIIAANLNPYSGIFHSSRGLHYALSSDLMEQFRFLIDRIVLSLIHNRQITEQSFIAGFDGKFSRLSSDAMKDYIHRYEYTMRAEIKVGNELTSRSLIIDGAATQLMRCLRLGLEYKAYRMP